MILIAGVLRLISPIGNPIRKYLSKGNKCLAGKGKISISSIIFFCGFITTFALDRKAMPSNCSYDVPLLIHRSNPFVGNSPSPRMIKSIASYFRHSWGRKLGCVPPVKVIISADTCLATRQILATAGNWLEYKHDTPTTSGENSAILCFISLLLSPY